MKKGKLGLTRSKILLLFAAMTVITILAIPEIVGWNLTRKQTVAFDNLRNISDVQADYKETFIPKLEELLALSFGIHGVAPLGVADRARPVARRCGADVVVAGS